MPENIVTGEECKVCKICCKFEQDELKDAPTFTREMKEKIVKEVDIDVAFEQRGDLWQIILNKMPESSKYICPLLDEDKGCKLGDKRPFDCKTFPFYLMSLRGKLVITLNTDCKAIQDYKPEELNQFTERTMIPYMLDEIQKYPDLIVPYDDRSIILKDLGSIPINDKF